MCVFVSLIVRVCVYVCVFYVLCLELVLCVFFVFVCLWVFVCLGVCVFGYVFMGCDSSVSIPTRYCLGGPGIEPQWGGRDFPHPSIPALGPTQTTVQWAPCLYGLTQSSRDFDN